MSRKFTSSIAPSKEKLVRITDSNTDTCEPFLVEEVNSKNRSVVIIIQQEDGARVAFFDLNDGYIRHASYGYLKSDFLKVEGSNSVSVTLTTD